ncbi:Provides the rickettsial cell with host ATP in exchange for rickettsial ADP. This is an obligate exchange system. This energy acquiring activity is an important component of rickettsial parasitism [Seminavis robusta]|uniref:ADP,ATP carrier protein n=1 Tax=Seminavis robusta TaxID=568900 RepID=A0A9N8H7W7_9STRA|nr:Provides the rickettsial cell with host ATP in exchange for rickettsial ADP. This is an obligate exchange system. This energy acquiring activity is an important component of rickettsial parasitism [Seminavis robusta]|eukprot:Sro196_g083560.1 Provides the rickettsial cell with host ATP in exchange for rickettsial ADP. This is an obligate exchange system. This energy acquiring activity is an important component of rickettsial parasitism (656) ;mRNA; f:59444-61411
MTKKEGPKTTDKKSSKKPVRQEDDSHSDDDDYDDPNASLLNRKSMRRSGKNTEFDPLSSSWGGQNPREWQRPYWLGGSLCLILFAFWMLDSLKDPIFGDLVNGNLQRHQPIAKLVSVATTLALVVFLEYLSHAKKERQRRLEALRQRSNESVLEGGGTWTRMGFQDDEEPPEVQNGNAESTTLIYILVAYSAVFALIARVLQYRTSRNGSAPDTDFAEDVLTSWHFVGYFLYATIESFGSLAVASFWSFTNTTLSLEDAQRYYGIIIALAQLGAVGGSTMVTTDYPDTSLLVLASLAIILHLVVMAMYQHRFRPTNIQAIVASNTGDLSEVVEPFANSNRRQSLQSLISAASSANEESALWSGIHLILRHNYVLLLLGVSCLYEVSLTCLDYQMKMIGFERFQNSDHDGGLSFEDFMGHFGQIVNATSLCLSLFGFNFLIRRLGLRYTLRLFPTLLVIATVVAFVAFPGNLYVLFTSMSLLKAMTYSIHDPSTELLYLPTSNTIKFKAKFWIDIVGARVAKAIGSTINTYAGSVDRSVSVGSVPSFLTAVLLWAACYYIGNDFDHLIETGTIVGVGNGDVPPRRFTTTPNDDIHSGIYLHDGDEKGDLDGVATAEDEADFVAQSGTDLLQDSSIELNELNSAMSFQDPGTRRVSV